MDTTLQLISWAYLVTNSARVLAYFPQILSAWRCTAESAKAISKATWGMFALSHCTTTAYGLAVMQDLHFSAISFANFLCTAVVFYLICYKQVRNMKKGYFTRTLIAAGAHMVLTVSATSISAHRNYSRARTEQVAFKEA